MGRSVDAPGRAVRPIYPNAIADLAAQQFVAGHAEGLGLGIEERVLDGAQRLGDDAARARARDGVQFLVDAFMLADRLPQHARAQLLDDVADAGGTETFVEFAPTDRTIIGAELDKVVVAPARIAGQRFHRLHFRSHCLLRTSPTPPRAKATGKIARAARSTPAPNAARLERAGLDVPMSPGRSRWHDKERQLPAPAYLRMPSLSRQHAKPC